MTSQKPLFENILTGHLVPVPGYVLITRLMILGQFWPLAVSRNETLQVPPQNSLFSESPCLPSLVQLWSPCYCFVLFITAFCIDVSTPQLNK